MTMTRFSALMFSVLLASTSFAAAQQASSGLASSSGSASASSSASSSRSSGWSRFQDPERHVSFEFPAHIFQQKATDGGEGGVVFSTTDGRARLRVFGFVNSRNQTPQRHLAGIPEYRTERFHYVRTTSRFYVTSGVRGGMILYRRCNFSPRADRRVDCVQLEYPQAEKRAWDEVVTRISLSLRNTVRVISLNRPSPPPPTGARPPRPLEPDDDDDVATQPPTAIPAQPRTAAVTPLPRARPALAAPGLVVPKPVASEQPMSKPDLPAAETPKATEPPPVTAVAPALRVLLPGAPPAPPESAGESRGVALPTQPPARGPEPPAASAAPGLPPVQPLD